MADIRCLICNRVNDSSAEHCWYCNTILPKPTGPLTQKEREKLANLKKKISGAPNPDPEPHGDAPQKTPPESPAEEEVPDWLARIRRLKQAEDQGQPSGKPDWIEEEQPDWLAKLSQPEAEDTPKPPDAANRVAESKKPALDESLRIRNLPRETDEEQEFITNLLKPTPPIGEEDSANSSNGQLEQLQEHRVDDQSGQEFPAPEGPNDEDFLEVEDLLSDKENVRSDQKTVQESEPAVSAPTGKDLPFPLFIDNLPDWLSTEEPETKQPQDTGIDEEDFAGEIPERKIEKGRLPAWLQSLRPGAAGSNEKIGSETAQVMEDHGVLAGIAGTLPGADLSGRVLKTGDFTQELRVSAAQQKNAELFQSLLQPAREPKAVSADQNTAAPSEKLVRLFITILILLAVITPILAPGFSVIIPVLFPTEVVNTLGTVRALPTEKPVLVAAHFEAGLAGELDWAAQPVLKHLVTRGVPLALTSTNVVGFAILQEMVTQAIGGDPAYAKDKKVMDLGYLPGGAIGMGALVNDPLGTLPFTTDLQPVREHPSLGSLNSLSDFGALIILTDNPEFARTWVEQVDGGEADLPLLAVVSAQAAPLLQPYFASGQINGYVAGMSGALYYEMLTMRAGSATARFSAYQLSLLLVAVLIFAGGVVSLILAAPRPAKKKEAG